MPTKIPWCDEVLNVESGCAACSPGCQNCFAAAFAKRFWKRRRFSDIRIHPELLSVPLHWRKPRKILICSMGDLFHPGVPGYFIEQVFDMMLKCPQHTFLVLTKRIKEAEIVLRLVGEIPNLWIGVSVSTQKEWNEKIPILLDTPAPVHFVSLEPLLEPIFLQPVQDTMGVLAPDWIIIGCESISGRMGRFNIDPRFDYGKDFWNAAIDIIRQCRNKGVSVFMKQGPVRGKVGHDPKDWPPEARIQQWPENPVCKPIT